MEAKFNISIPDERIGVLIGDEGKVKRRIERVLNVTVNVHSDSGVVEVIPKNENTDPLAMLKAKDVIQAIGRGFPPDKAFSLFDEDAILQIIDLRDLFGKSESEIKRVKGRVIGREGKTRRIIEETTDTKISIYGHTISIIGNYEAAATTKEAIEMFIEGRQHATIYKFLRNRRKESKKGRILDLWEKPVEG